MGPGLASAVLGGTAVVAATALAVDRLRPAGTTGPGAAPGSAPPTPDLASVPAVLLVAGTLLGLLVAAGLAWYLLAPIGSIYRRGALALVSSFATVLLMLVCLPVRLLLGPPGLVGLAALLAALAVLLARRAHRAAWAEGRP